MNGSCQIDLVAVTSRSIPESDYPLHEGLSCEVSVGKGRNVEAGGPASGAVCKKCWTSSGTASAHERASDHGPRRRRSRTAPTNGSARWHGVSNRGTDVADAAGLKVVSWVRGPATKQRTRGITPVAGLLHLLPMRGWIGCEPPSSQTAPSRWWTCAKRCSGVMRCSSDGVSARQDRVRWRRLR